MSSRSINQTSCSMTQVTWWVAFSLYDNVDIFKKVFFESVIKQKQNGDDG